MLEEKKKSPFYEDHPDVLLIQNVWWIHKYEVALAYGGPEEGGWWFDTGVPTGFTMGPFTDEEAAYEQCRVLNYLEYERAEREETYDYSSVLSYRSNHYSYSVEDSPIAEPYPKVKPHYE
jgi:hypothetical protein